MAEIIISQEEGLELATDLVIELVRSTTHHAAVQCLTKALAELRVCAQNIDPKKKSFATGFDIFDKPQPEITVVVNDLRLKKSRKSSISSNIAAKSPRGDNS